MIDLDVAFDKLAQFVDPREIADFLLEQGVCGYQKRSMDCPIASFMQGTTGVMVRVGQGRMTVSMFQPVFGDATTTQSILRWGRDNTCAIAQFIHAFDRGEFPELIQAPPVTVEDGPSG